MRRYEHAIITGTRATFFRSRLLPGFTLACVGVVLAHVSLSQWSNDLFPLQLPEADLSGFVLSGADFRGANLYKANLQSADLSGAHLEGAILVSANLEEANLVGAHLEGAYMRFANLRGASLVNATLEGAQLIDAHLDGAYLLNAHLEGADLTSAFLIGAELSTTNPERYTCQDSKVYGCQTQAIGGTHLQGAVLHKAHLEGSVLNSAKLDGADLSEAYLDAALLSYASLVGTNLEGASFHGATVAGITFGLYRPTEFEAWLSENAARFDAVPRLDTNLVELLKSRLLVEKPAENSDLLETLRTHGACDHKPGNQIGVNNCAEQRRARLSQLAQGENARDDTQISAIKDAWCIETVRLYWKAWHGFKDKGLELIPCPGLAWSGTAE